MNAGSKIRISWTFAWLGVPLLYAVLRLLIRSVGPPVWVNVLVLLVFVAAGTLFVRERLQPQPGWIVPLYAGVMLVLLFLFGALVELRYATDF